MSQVTTIEPTAIADTREQEVVSHQQLRDILIQRKGCAFCAIDATYSMDDKGKMNKRGNPYIGKGLQKKTTTTVMVTFDYAASVERRTDGEQTAPGGPTWHRPVFMDSKLTPLSVHQKDVTAYDDNGKPISYRDDARIYLRGEFVKSESRYVLNGQAVDKEDIKPYLPKRSSTGPVQFQLVKFDNIDRLRIDKTEYVLK